ncbi:hypothetical protein [Acinetobacter sp.]
MMATSPNLTMACRTAAEIGVAVRNLSGLYHDTKAVRNLKNHTGAALN